MTAIYERPGYTPDQPGTHVLVIAVGSYPHLAGGDEDLVEEPMGLGQLTSPPVSAEAVVAWFLGRVQGGAGTPGFSNPLAPLASIEVAASPGVLNLPGAAGSPVDEATKFGIENCFESWRARCIGNPESIAVFYFCGHGVMVADEYLLAEDFGGGNPWTRAFNLTQTVRCLTREIAGPMYFFIDACRQIPRSLTHKLGANPLPLRPVDLNRQVLNSSYLILYAAGEGKSAYAVQGQVSRYTRALIEILSGYAGRKRPGTQEWEVTGEDIAHSVRKLLEVGHRAGEPKQVVGQELNAPSVFHVDPAPPRVKVALDLLPDARRLGHRVFFQRQGDPAQEWDAVQCPWRTETPRGFYNVGARPDGSQNPVVLLENEDFEPPCYDYTIDL